MNPWLLKSHNMLLLLWRKKNADSSTQYARKKHAAEVNETAFFRCAAFILLMILSSTVTAKGIHHEKKIPFDIPQQRADTSLIKFAEQADLTLIVPFDEVRVITANRLVGEYRIEEALELLLSGTGLKATVGDGIRITIVSEEEERLTMLPKKPTSFVAAFLSMFGASEVTAQEGGSDNNLAIEEIIVNAERREAGLQDVPISITAFSGEMIEKRNIGEAKDYLAFTPNVSFTEDGQAGQRSVGIAIRGISNVAIGEQTVSNTFGIYVDEFNVAANPTGSVNPQLHDIAVVEVLRGPQGTYFGRNALGGAINITTNKPDADPFAEISLQAGNFGTVGASGIVNLPIAENLFVRGVISQESSDGIISNVSSSGSDDDYDHLDFRGAVRWLPTENFTVDLSYSYTEEDDGADSNINSGVWDIDTHGSALFVYNFHPDFSTVSPAVTRDDLLSDGGVGFYKNNQRHINKNTKEYNRGEGSVVNLRLSYEGENFSIKSITGYLDTEHDRRFDQDVIEIDGLTRDNRNSAETISQEIRVAGTKDNIDWTVGALYGKDEVNRYSDIYTGLDGYGVFFPNPGVSIFQRDDTFEMTSFAVFGDVTWHLSDQLSIAAGLRYTQDKVENEIRDLNAAASAEDDDTFTDVSPRVNVRYEFHEDLSMYATISKGYKAGGVQLNTGSPAESIEEEGLWNYEVGMKGEFFDNRLRVNGAVFFMDWKDLQAETAEVVTTAGSSNVITRTDNVDAEAQGVELELTALMSENLIVGGGIGYLDAKFDEFPYSLQGVFWDLSDKRIPRSPEWTINAFAEYSRTVTDGVDAWIRAEYSYRSETHADLEGLASGLAPTLDPGGFQASSDLPYPRDSFPFEIPSFGVVNLRAGIDSEQWSITGFVENLLDKDYYTGTQENFGLGGIRLRPHPRTYGLKFTYKTDF